MAGCEDEQVGGGRAEWSNIDIRGGAGNNEWLTHRLRGTALELSRRVLAFATEPSSWRNSCKMAANKACHSDVSP